MGEPYNPLDKFHLGESVAKALLTRPIEALPPRSISRGRYLCLVLYREISGLRQGCGKESEGSMGRANVCGQGRTSRRAEGRVRIRRGTW